jgi:hypothetical protein
MKKLIAVLFVLATVGCASKESTPVAKDVPTEKKIAGPIALQTTIPFRSGAAEDKIKNECPDINTKLSDFTKEHGKELGVEFAQTPKVDMKAKGGVLVMEITNMHSGGNAFIGHNKSTTIKAQLYKDGTLVDTVELTRSSGGGIGAGFKGSCSVLGRTVKTLGSDIATWAKNYKM